MERMAHVKTICEFDTGVWRDVTCYLGAKEVGNLLLVGDKRLNVLILVACKSLVITHCIASHILPSRLAAGRALNVGLESLFVHECNDHHVVQAEFDQNLYIDMSKIHLSTSLTSLHLQKFVVKHNDDVRYQLPSSLTDLQIGKIILVGEGQGRFKSCFNFVNLKLHTFGIDCRGTPVRFQKSIATFVIKFCSGTLCNIRFLSDRTLNFTLCTELERAEIVDDPDCIVLLPFVAEVVLHPMSTAGPCPMFLLPHSHILQTLDIRNARGAYLHLDITPFSSLKKLVVKLCSRMTVAPSQHLDIYTYELMATFCNKGPGTVTIHPNSIKLIGSFSELRNFQGDCVIDYDSMEECRYHSSPYSTTIPWQRILKFNRIKRLTCDSIVTGNESSTDFTPIQNLVHLVSLKLHLCIESWTHLESSGAIPTSVTSLELTFWSRVDALSIPQHVKQLTLNDLSFDLDMLHHFPPLESLKISGTVARRRPPPPPPTPPNQPSTPVGVQLVKFLFNALVGANTNTACPEAFVPPINQYEPPQVPFDIPHVWIVLEGCNASDISRLFPRYLQNVVAKCGWSDVERRTLLIVHTPM